MLLLPNKDVWTFNATRTAVELEESVYLAGPDGPRRTVQIVIYGRARKVPRVQLDASIACTAAGARRSAAARRDAIARNEPATAVDSIAAADRTSASPTWSPAALTAATPSEADAHDRPSPPRHPRPASPCPTRPG